MIIDSRMIPIAENTAITSFEAKRTSMYIRAREFDKVPPETLPENVVFSDDNPFAKEWRKMLH
jgi:hypothetical protein